MKEKNRKKRNIMSGIGIFLVIVVIFICWLFARKTVILSVGETVLVDSEIEEQNRKIGLPANQCLFDGKIEITLLDSKLYHNNEEAKISDTFMNSDQEDGMSFLLVTFRICNLDAEPYFPEGFLSTCFRLIPYNEVDSSVKKIRNMDIFDPEVRYSSVFKENVEKDEGVLRYPKEGYYFQLEKGTSKEIQIGFWVEKENYEENKILVKLSTGNSGKPKNVFELQKK